MVTVVKHEWHRVDSQFEFDFDEDLLSKIYPDYTEVEITDLLTSIENGEADIDEIVSEALDNNVDIDWDPVYDDWYTHRKGGYDVTFEVKDSDE